MQTNSETHTPNSRDDLRDALLNIRERIWAERYEGTPLTIDDASNGAEKELMCIIECIAAIVDGALARTSPGPVSEGMGGFEAWINSPRNKTRGKVCPSIAAQIWKAALATRPSFTEEEVVQLIHNATPRGIGDSANYIARALIAAGMVNVRES